MLRREYVRLDANRDMQGRFAVMRNSALANDMRGYDPRSEGLALVAARNGRYAGAGLPHRVLSGATAGCLNTA